MVKVLDQSTGKEFYLDGILQQNLDSIKPKVKENWDMVFVVSGIEGGGKSTLGFQLARYLAQKRFTLDHVCFSPEDFMKKITKKDFLKQGDCLLLDEGFLINSRASMTKLNRMFLSVMAECRQKNLFLIIVCPNFFDLDKNLALWRSRGMFYIYHDKLNRGYFKYYGYESKKKLYVKGKKFYSYSAQKPDFFGRFTKYMPLDEKGYVKYKLRAFENRDRTQQEDRSLTQRNICFMKLHDLGMSYQNISDYLKTFGESITMQGISKACASTLNRQPTINKLNPQRDMDNDGSELEETEE